MAISPEQRLLALEQVEDAARLKALLEQLIGLLSQPQPAPDLSAAFAPFIDATLELRTAIEELKAQARSVPVIEVPPAQAPNLEPLNDLIQRVEKAVSEIPEKVRKNFGDMRISGGTKASVKVETVNGEMVNPATEETLKKLLENDTGQESRFDYGIRSDAKPERIGTAPVGTAQNSPIWKISTFTYDSQARVTAIVPSEGPWT